MTFYDDFGHEVAPTSVHVEGEAVGDISEIAYRGRQPDFEKETLIGKRLTVHGIVGPEDFALGPVYFLLIRREEDKREDEPFGVMFPAASPVIKLALAASRQKKLPFTGTLVQQRSETHPDQAYWNWQRN